MSVKNEMVRVRVESAERQSLYITGAGGGGGCGGRRGAGPCAPPVGPDAAARRCRCCRPAAAARPQVPVEARAE